MRKFTVLAILLVVIAVPSTMFASSVGAYAAYWDTDDAGSGVGPGVKLKIDILPVISLDLRIARVDLDDLDITVTPMELALVGNIPLDAVVPYLGLGVGYYDVDSDGGLSTDSVGGFGLVGLEIRFGDNFGIFGEARYVAMAADIDTALQIAEDFEDNEITFNGFGANLGILIRW
jgi:hypothetical protein